MKLKYLYVTLLSFILFSCNSQTGIKTIDASSFSEKINEAPKVQILDVRTPEEYTSGHIKNADNVNWLSDTFSVQTEKYDRTKPVYVYCKSGKRSLAAANKLAELGFTTIYNLEGGILKWEAAGFSNEKN